MATGDVRQESPEVIYELRIRAVEMKLQGLAHDTIAKTLDVSIAASRLWWAIYKEGGRESLKLGKRGRPPGALRRLTKSQEKIVRRTITTSMVSAIGNRGDARFMIFKGGLKADTFIRFLARLIKGAKRKIFLIVDNLRAHKAKVVEAWVAEHAKQIRLFFLPPYSPELNPDEYLNNTVKSRMRNQPPASAQSELRAQLSKIMKSAQRKPDLIQSLFKHPNVTYAA